MVGWATRARDLGFTAAKLEATFSGPYAHKGLSGPDEWVVEVAREVRAAAGPEMTLMVDAQYAFDTVERALRVAERIAEYDIFFLETPLWTDDLDGYARLAAASPVPIAAGEWLSSRHEFAAADRPIGASTSSSPTSAASAGSRRRGACATWPANAGLLVVPHAWKTGISVAAAAHLATVTPHMPFFEFLPAELCESRLRKELTVDELVFAERPARDPGAAGPRRRAQPRRRSASSRRPRRVSPDLRAAQVADALDAMGVRDRCISRLTQFLPGRTVVGAAFTLRALHRGARGAERYAGLLAAIDAVKAGDVVVVASGPSDAAAVWGELLSTACLARGAVGAVTDGLSATASRRRRSAIPVFARGTSPLDIHGRLEVVAHGVEVTVAGVPSPTGDTVVADADGVVVVPRRLAAEALERAAAKARGEGDFRDAVAEGASATEAFRRFDVLLDLAPARTARAAPDS